MLVVDPERPATPARAASTVVVARDSVGGPEVFCVQRATTMGFWGGAVVFPGGKVDARDSEPEARALAGTPSARAVDLAEGDRDLAATLLVAALRELLEEAALVPTAGIAVDDGTVRAVRESLVGGRSFAEALADHGVAVDASTLVPLARWITPLVEAKRFDTRFYILRAPVGQTGLHDDRETTRSFWAPPREVLGRFMGGELVLAPPTTRTLKILAEAESVDAIVDLANRHCLEPICPVFVPADAGFALALPGDPAHPVPERRIAGPTRFVLREGRLVGE